MEYSKQRETMRSRFSQAKIDRMSITQCQSHILESWSKPAQLHCKIIHNFQ